MNSAEDQMLAKQYREKAKNCVDLAKSAGDAERLVFMELAELWAKMAMQLDSLPGEETNIAHLADHRTREH